MMSDLIIIAGPQAAGKSSLIASLGAQYQNVAGYLQGTEKSLLFPMQESRQIIVHKHMLLGAIWMTVEHEREVIACDFERMDLILKRNERRLVYADECNVFTIGHAMAHGVTGIEGYWDEYMKRLELLNAKIIFLDIPPETSWERRQHRYEQRLVYFPKDEHKAIMERYRDYLFKAHKVLVEVFDRLPFPKRMVDASVSKKGVFNTVYRSLMEFTLADVSE